MHNSKCYCLRVPAKVMYVSFVDTLKAKDIGFCFDNIASRGGVAFLIGNTYIPIYWNKWIGLAYTVPWNCQLRKWSGHRSKQYWEWCRFFKFLYSVEAHGRVKPLVETSLLCQTGSYKRDTIHSFQPILLFNVFFFYDALYVSIVGLKINF